MLIEEQEIELAILLLPYAINATIDHGWLFIDQILSLVSRRHEQFIAEPSTKTVKALT